MIKVMGNTPASQEWYCDAIYQGGLYIVTAILEAIIILVVGVLSIKTMNYLKRKKKKIAFSNFISLGTVATCSYSLKLLCRE